MYRLMVNSSREAYLGNMAAEREPSVFDYANYRDFLKDYYDFQKKKNKRFSYQAFANRARFNAKTFLYNVIKGVKGLPKSSVFNVSQAMKLGKRESEYFEALVFFNEAKTVQEKEHYFKKLQVLSKTHIAAHLRGKQFAYFSEWYHVVIREAVTLLDFQGDFQKLAKFVDPPITTAQARQSVDLLLKLGLVEKRTSGRYAQTDKALTTGDEVTSAAVQKFQKKNLELAARSLDVHEREERDISTLTVGISKNTLQTLKSEIRAFRRKLALLVDEGDDPTDVYQINFQLFPLTARSGKRSSKS